MSTRIVCDWSGHLDSEGTYTKEECDNSRHIYASATGWVLSDSEDVVGDFCPDHAKYICKGCGEPNLYTERCPNAGDICINCCDCSH